MDSHQPQRRNSWIHALRKSAGSQRQSESMDRILITNSLEGESQESPMMMGYLDVKEHVFNLAKALQVIEKSVLVALKHILRLNYGEPEWE